MLSEKVAALSNPNIYALADDQIISTIETHMSWVFLTPEHAFKLKKPVHKDCLDFITLGKRHFFCQEEIRLNRRLAADTYIETLELRQQTSGQYTLSGKGGIVDYLVKMNRLPAQKMLDYLIAKQAVTAQDLAAITSILVNFFKQAKVIPITPQRYQKKFTTVIQATALKISSLDYGLPEALVESLRTALISFATPPQSLLIDRAINGHIVDGHGDLRAEHVYLGTSIQIIDCIEFSEQLRQNDPLDEVAFLAMEFERLNAKPLGNLLLEQYQQTSGDSVSPELISFYQCYRAYIRARLAIEHLDDFAVNNPQHWRDVAQNYLLCAKQKSEGFSASNE